MSCPNQASAIPSPGSLRTLSVCLLFGLLLNPGMAVSQVLLELLPTADTPELPVAVNASQMVAIDGVLLAQLEEQSRFAVEISEQQTIEFTTSQVSRYLNGDRHIGAEARAGGESYSMTLTVGPNRLFGYIAAGALVWQIDAEWREQGYLGWANLPAGLAAASLHDDYFIPAPGPTPPRLASVVAPVQPLQVNSDNTTVAGSQAASLPNISANNLRLTQRYTPDPVLSGEVTTATITLENISNELHTGLALQVFFILEDSTLVSASPACSEQLSLSLQSIIYCSVGSLAPGESRIFSYSVSVTDPGLSYLSSSAVVGELRDDVIVNVVEDVRTDSDQDGISDFNERLLSTDPMDANSVDYSPSVIDVMALYTPGAAALYPGAAETRINQLFGVANQVYRDSKVGIKLRPVHHAEVAASDTDDMDTMLAQLMAGSGTEFSGVNALRDKFGADLVVLFRTLEPAASRCGLAPVGGYKTNGYFRTEIERDLGFSVIALDCPVELVVAHELGHNMGLTHSHLEEGAGGTFNFATGYGVDSQFVTVMATPAAFNTETRVARFSDPSQTCLGFACGLSSAEAQGADAVQALNLVRHQVANFSAATVLDLTERSVASSSGESTDAVIAIAASNDDGLSFSETFTIADRVDISVSIRPDPKHLGAVGSLHVLVGLKNEADLYQLNSRAELERWDGEPDSLVPLGEPRIMTREENLALLQDFQFSNSLVGLELVVYVAYQIPDQGVLIYTTTPLDLKIEP